MKIRLSRIHYVLPIVAISAASLLASCGGSSGGGEVGATGTLSMAITDAPVDDASEVNVQFIGVALKPANGDEVLINFDSPRTIDLLALQGGQSQSLFDGRQVPAGQYEWVRLLVNAQRNTLDSYIVLDGNAGQRSLFVPSGSQSGLRLVSGFTVPVNGAASFTIDFDLRKSVTAPQNGGDYFLKPALRMVNNAEVGAVQGTVASPILEDQSCPSTEPAQNSNVVYVFAGANATPSDISTNLASSPVTTAMVSATNGVYAYRAAFLTPGDYTVAFTCQAANDDPESVQTLTFLGTQNVTVANGANTVANFVAPVQ